MLTKERFLSSTLKLTVQRKETNKVTKERFLSSKIYLFAQQKKDRYTASWHICPHRLIMLHHDNGISKTATVAKSFT